MGANSVIFSAVRGILLSPLPYPEPDRIVQVWTQHRASPELFTLLEERLTRVEKLDGSHTVALSLETRGDAWEVLAGQVTSGHFDLLGATPAMGRTFTRADEAPGSEAVVRTEGDPRALVGAVRAAVKNVDPAVPINRIVPMSEVVSGSSARSRLFSGLLAGLAALALLLGALGIYGVISYGVSQRRREIAVRMALGANRRTVLGEVIRGGLRPVALGLLSGLVLAAFGGRLLSGEPYEVPAYDPLTFGVVTVVVMLVATVAAMGPAVRAAGVDPIQTLRED